MAVVKCVFCGKEQEDYKGSYLLKNDGSVLYFSSSKCLKNHIKLGRDKRKVRWTESFFKTREKRYKKAKESAEREVERRAKKAEREAEKAEKKAEKEVKMMSENKVKKKVSEK